ncbi:hypothetical protein BCR44DRAFT_97777 [Catenaria anguillulae PL171]|uniref:Uncharacterized protein n=1 Tax=Catenaria anguillulae PL171 TaxID=765915 RepID=A0A1Y2HPL7_9FUNG|nr:hypothetical protein BCR44DRAFT_97777 [Catenaria anguillulae PL171]
MTAAGFGTHLPMAAPGSSPRGNRQDCAVLRQMFADTHGSDGWSDIRGWMNPVDQETSCCSWAGIRCDAAGRVTALLMRNNSISGLFPEGLANLTRLATLDLYHNQIEGTLPPKIATLSNLRYLDISDNYMSESIPPEVFTMPALTQFDAYANHINGSLPTTFAPQLATCTPQYPSFHSTLQGNSLACPTVLPSPLPACLDFCAATSTVASGAATPTATSTQTPDNIISLRPGPMKGRAMVPKPTPPPMSAEELAAERSALAAGPPVADQKTGGAPVLPIMVISVIGIGLVLFTVIWRTRVWRQTKVARVQREVLGHEASRAFYVGVETTEDDAVELGAVGRR